MLCEKVVPLLSEYFDEALDAETAIQVSQHLDKCARCRKELGGISAVHDKLKSLSGSRAPDYFPDLMHLRLEDMSKNRWRTQVRNALERQWSLIRTTEGVWYANRILGTIMTAVLVILISNGINPISVESAAPKEERVANPVDYGKRVFRHVQAKFGRAPAQVPQGRNVQQSAIHYGYLDELGRNLPEIGKDDTFSVVATIDPSGKPKIQTVLDPPSDKTILTDLAETISSARCRPASKNGQLVPSYLVLIVSRIYVYN